MSRARSGLPTPPGGDATGHAPARRRRWTSLRVVRAVLRNPALRRVQVAFLLFNGVMFGSWIAALLYAYDASGPAAVGLVALVQLLPAALLAPFLASLGDRFRGEHVLVAGYLAQALAFGVAGFGMLAGAPPALVYLAGAAAVSSLTITRPVQGSLLPALSRTPEELTAANGLSGAVEGAGVLIGPLAAAVIMAFATPGVVFAVATMACLVAGLLVVRLPRPGIPAATVPGALIATPSAWHAGSVGNQPEHVHPRAADALLDGVRAIGGHADTRLVVGLLALRMLSSGAMDILFVLLALEVFHTGGSGAGILNAGLGIGTVLGGAASFALVGRRRIAPVLAASALAWGAAILVVGTIATTWVAPVVVALGGVGYAATDIAGRTILQRVTPHRLLARVLGALEGIGLVGLSLGSVLVPVLVGAFGVRATVLVVGLLLPTGVALGWAGLRRIDRRVRVPVREVALLRATPVFAPLPAPQLEAVAGRTRWLTLEPGEVLIKEGELGDRYYVVESGVLRVSIGGRFVRDTDGPGEGVGEIALLHGVPRTATVTALEACVLLALERADFLEAVTGHEQAHEVVRRVASARRDSAPSAGGAGPP